MRRGKRRSAVGSTGLWDVARRRWQVLAVSIEIGVGVALIATTVADSSRPLRDILLGLLAGLVLGLSLLTPVDHSAVQQQAEPRTPWPHPELTEQPQPTFAPPGRF